MNAKKTQRIIKKIDLCKEEIQAYKNILIDLTNKYNELTKDMQELTKNRQQLHTANINNKINNYELKIIELNKKLELLNK